MPPEALPGPGQVHPSNALAFILAGAATFTLRSQKTGARFTFHVMQTSGTDWRVMLLTGPEQFTHVGGIHSTESRLVECWGFANWKAPYALALHWTLVRLQTPKDVDQLEIFHDGKCSACGRALTTPESVVRGLGPICWEKAQRGMPCS